MSYKIIACCDIKYGIGKEGYLPWSNTEAGKIDMQHFVESTKNNIVCMGRKTWDSIPAKYKPLKNRINIIFSKTLKNTGSKTLEDTNTKVYIFDSIDRCHNFLNSHEEYKKWKRYIRWIIGGKEIYTEYLKRNWVHEIVLTQIHNDYKCDIFLPNFKKFKIYHSKPNLISLSKLPYIITIMKYWYNNDEEYQYLNLLQNILDNGNKRPDRTGVGTISSFGHTLKYKLYHNEQENSYVIPMLTTKRVWFKGVFEELMWFLNGQTDSKILESKGINIWKGNSSREFLDSRELKYPEGENGPIYGKQWRNWSGIDQIENIIEGLREDPFSRRHILSAWNVSDLDKMSLVPCHMTYMFYVTEIDGEKYLSCMMFQRSGDMFLGIPFNLTSMALLTLLIATQADMKPYELIHCIGDAHIYNNHIEQVTEQLKRKTYPFPRIKIIKKKEKIENYTLEDIILIDYICHNTIKGKMAV